MISDLTFAIRSLTLLPAEGEDDRIIQSWLIYLAVLAHDAAAGAVSCLRERNSRAANTLQRQIYEYIVLAKFSIMDPSKVISQTKARKERHYTRLKGLNLQEQRRQEIDAAQTAWRRDNVGIGEHDGSIKFRKMAETADTISRYNYHYSIPSILVHGDVVGFMDVFEETVQSTKVSMTSLTVKPEACAASIAMFLQEWLKLLESAGADRVSPKYDNEMLRLSVAIAKLWKVKPSEA